MDDLDTRGLPDNPDAEVMLCNMMEMDDCLSFLDDKTNVVDVPHQKKIADNRNVHKELSLKFLLKAHNNWVRKKIHKKIEENKEKMLV